MHKPNGLACAGVSTDLGYRKINWTIFVTSLSNTGPICLIATEVHFEPVILKQECCPKLRVCIEYTAS